MLASHLSRQAIVRQTKHLEYFTIGWNCIEGIVAVIAGAIAGSISLVGFGVDSFIEVTSGVAVLWQISLDVEEHHRERSEAAAVRIIGSCFIALAVYVAYEAGRSLYAHKAPEHSIPGIVLAVVSLVVMPLLSNAKRRVGAQLRSASVKADAKQTEFCAFLSAILLGGLLLNAIWGIWWADPVAALVMVPIIVREGLEALRGDMCCD